MLLLMKLSSKVNPEESIPFQALNPHRRLLREEREDRVWGCLFPKRGECRSTPARHAANLFLRTKTSQRVNEELKTINITNQTHN